jgi:hypothetical protein
VTLVITTNRIGEAFGCFFWSLFQQMFAGVSMPMAWVTLAPQVPARPGKRPGRSGYFGTFFTSLFLRIRNGFRAPNASMRPASNRRAQLEDGPGTICLMGAGQVAFAE